MNPIFPQPAWRLVALGLVVSAAGALGIVSMASAHDHSPPGAQPVVARAPMGPMGAPPILPLAGPALDRLLDDLKATDEQRSKLQLITQAAQADLKAPTEAARADHAKLAELFSQPTVDATAVEALRQQMLARQDTISKRMNSVLLDTAQVLTLEQRQHMVERIKQHAGRPMHGEHGQPRS